MSVSATTDSAPERCTGADFDAEASRDLHRLLGARIASVAGGPGDLLDAERTWENTLPPAATALATISWNASSAAPGQAACLQVAQLQSAQVQFAHASAQLLHEQVLWLQLVQAQSAQTQFAHTSAQLLHWQSAHSS